MCLAVPGKLVAIEMESGMTMGRVDFDGATGHVCLDCVPEVRVGQYVIVHAGFALSILDEEEAVKSIALLEELRESADAESVMLQDEISK